MNNPSQKVAILGCGTIGASWAALFSASGLSVVAWDPAPGFAAKLQERVRLNHAALAEMGRLNENVVPIETVATPRDAVIGAGFVQESAIEDLAAKKDLYRSIAPALSSDAIVASSTSFLTPSDLQEDVEFAPRLCIGHPFNPPHLIPLVEVVGGRQTAPETLDRASDIYRFVGKRVVRLKKEMPGHLVNRLQAALWREAIHAVVDGIADVADVDAAIAYGPGLRWALMGPHLTFHLAGGDGGMEYFIDHLGDANEAAWRDLGKPRLDEATAETLIDGCKRATAGQSIDALRQKRDAQLLALLKSTERVL